MKNLGIVTSALLFTASLSLVGCGQSPNQSAKETSNKATTEQTANNNQTEPENKNLVTYKVGLDINYPPYDFQDEYGNAQGFDVDILKAIAVDQQFSVDLIPLRWEKLIESANDGTYQIVMGGFAGDADIPDVDDVSDEMEQHYHMSNPYIYAQDAVALLDEDLTVNSMKQLKDRKIATLVDTNWVDLITNLSGDKNNVLVFNTSYQTLESLIQKKAGATLNDRGVLKYYASQFPEFNINITGEGSEFFVYDLVFLASKQDPEILNKVNTGLNNIIQSGEYSTIYKKWFGTEPEIIPQANSTK